MPSAHVCSNFVSPASPHFSNQAPPRAQQLRVPDPFVVPHLAHALPFTTNELTILTIPAGVKVDRYADADAQIIRMTELSVSAKYLSKLGCPRPMYDRTSCRRCLHIYETKHHREHNSSACQNVWQRRTWGTPILSVLTSAI